MEGKRRSVARLAERQNYKDRANISNGTQIRSNQNPNKAKCFFAEVEAEHDVSENSRSSRRCLIHDSAKHTTEKCNAFIQMAVDERFEKVKASRACFRCFGDHLIRECHSFQHCSSCNSSSHHLLLCRRHQGEAKVRPEAKNTFAFVFLI